MSTSAVKASNGSAVLLWILLGCLIIGCGRREAPDSPEESKAVAFGDKFIRLLHAKKWKEAYALTSVDYRKLRSMAKLRDEFESIGYSGSFFQSLNARSSWPLTEKSLSALYQTNSLPPSNTWRANVFSRVGEPDASHTFVELGVEVAILVVETPEGLRAGRLRFSFSD